MSRGAAQRPRVVVVHVADQQTARLGPTRRGGSLLPEFGRKKLQVLRVLHLAAQRVELRVGLLAVGGSLGWLEGHSHSSERGDRIHLIAADREVSCAPVVSPTPPPLRQDGQRDP